MDYFSDDGFLQGAGGSIIQSKFCSLEREEKEVLDTFLLMD
jgi:hypothetical protein